MSKVICFLHTSPKICPASKENKVPRGDYTRLWHICKLNANVSVNTVCGVDQAGDDECDNDILGLNMFEHWQDFVKHRGEIWHRNHHHGRVYNYLSIFSF